MNDARAVAAKSYLHEKIRSANPAELISLLYEGLIRELRLAAGAIERNEIAAKGTAIGRAISILGALQFSLDRNAGGELATNLARLYDYWMTQLTRANLDSDVKLLLRVIKQSDEVRTAWNDGVVNESRGRQPAAVDEVETRVPVAANATPATPSASRGSGEDRPASAGGVAAHSQARVR